MSPGLGATVGATAGALGFMGTRGLREGTGEPCRFSVTEFKRSCVAKTNDSLNTHFRRITDSSAAGR